MKSFEDLGIDESLSRVLKQEGITTPTAVQESAIPLILKGHDVVAESATGSGKTLAFSSGILKNTIRGDGVQALILCPTRELAQQVAKNIKLFSRANKIRGVCVYGGVPINTQIRHLKTADVVIGTPGRVLDHIDRRTLDLSDVNTIVLDECDTMLDMGFVHDVEKIMKACPHKRQTLFFTATLSQDIGKLVKKFMRNPQKVSIASHVDPTLLEQVYYELPHSRKFSLLTQLLLNIRKSRVMVFCNTKRMCDKLGKNLRHYGIRAREIHGDLPQKRRSIIMDRFHDHDFQVLVCTDVAARGLHVPDVSHVYNYDVPADSRQYTHRIGRTARAGAKGLAVTFLGKRNEDVFRRILREHSIAKHDVPKIVNAEMVFTTINNRPKRFAKKGERVQKESRNKVRKKRRDDARDQEDTSYDNRGRRFGTAQRKELSGRRDRRARRDRDSFDREDRRDSGRGSRFGRRDRDSNRDSRENERGSGFGSRGRGSGRSKVRSDSRRDRRENEVGRRFGGRFGGESDARGSRASGRGFSSRGRDSRRGSRGRRNERSDSGNRDDRGGSSRGRNFSRSSTRRGSRSDSRGRGNKKPRRNSRR